jgi:hypothetical protein
MIIYCNVLMITLEYLIMLQAMLFKGIKDRHADYCLSMRTTQAGFFCENMPRDYKRAAHTTFMPGQIIVILLENI